ncbi:MAG: DNA-3-methyladenine glycosylase I [Anaerolineae bacterium]
MNRCAWGSSNPLMIEYHDTEWGVPLHDEQKLFEFLVLEGMQAGLSWSTILNKRENFRAAFHNFEVARVARYTQRDVERLLKNAGIIRNRLKIEATINNAKRFIEVQNEFGSFDAYVWRFVDGKPIKNAWQSMGEIPPKTPLSDAISKDLLKRGFKFVGSTIVYAHMQATGMVNDHTVDCFRYNECR